MHIIINGGGKVGSFLASKLINSGHSVAIIEMDSAEVFRLTKELPSSLLIIHGDGCDSAIQMDAGADHADIFASVTGKDDDNLVACEIAKMVNDVPRCIARVNNPKNERIFRRVGIESVSSTTVIARLIEEEAMAGTIQTITTFRSNNVDMLSLRIPLTTDDPSMARRVRDIKLPKGSLLIAIKRGEHLEIISGDTFIFPGDEVLFICEYQLVDDVRTILDNIWL
ncbi:MAG: NAD-binding protein [bacterium]|nr:NAD-binding protein [bacterium]